MQMTTEYDKQANDFLEKTGTTLSIKCIKYGKHFRTDTEDRFVYEFTLERNGRKYSSNFGDSIAHAHDTILGKSRLYRGPGVTLNGELVLKSVKVNSEKQTFLVTVGSRMTCKPVPLPSAYSILSCLEKYEPAKSVDDFASDFGYKVGGKIKIQDIIDIHNACIEQYKGLCMLFNEQEMEELREIN